jgi:putative N6-adenine-specific DNA methylase
MMQLYATIGVGLETVVSREMEALGLQPQRVEPGRVRFEADLQGMLQAIIHLRTVSRVVREVHFEQIDTETDIYDVARDIDWPALFPVDATFRVTFNVHSSLVKNSLFQTYRIKDAIADRFVQQCGRRPDVDTRAPQVHVYGYLENRRLSLGLDAAGDPLHMRGYRAGQHAASLREHLAAAMVLQSGWAPPAPLHDPFCGSGTLLIEAARIATRTPPSALRARFGCESWTGFDAPLLARLREQAMQERVQVPGLRVAGGDSDPAAIALAAENLRAAGLTGLIGLRCQDVREMEPLHDGVVIANPPYGERLSDPGIRDAWLGLREAALRCTGSTVVVLQANPEFEKVMSLRPFKKNRMNNGALMCTLYQYRVRARD